jgi:hypothetical protein
MLPISMELSKCFLQDGHPDGHVLAQTSEDSVSIVKWKIIIDDLGERNTNLVHLEGVDSICADIIVDENFINSSFAFSKS